MTGTGGRALPPDRGDAVAPGQQEQHGEAVADHAPAALHSGAHLAVGSRAGDWTSAELATLAAVFETFVAGGAIRRAGLAADLLAEIADPGDLRLLRLVLRLLESRPANLALGGGATRFRDLSPERRERLLLGWGLSRVPQRRTAFQTLKRLAGFLAYADPGPEGTNPLWTRIGYRPVEEPITDQPPVVAPLAPPPVDGTWVLETDVAVVGSGAGGGVVAAGLAAAGRDVVVIEAGPYIPEREMSPREFDGFSSLFLDRGMTSTTDLGVAILAGGSLGGGTTVNWTSCFAPPEWLRAAWARDHGLEGFDGPATVEDVAVLEQELGFSLPPSIPPKDRVLLDGAAALGWQAAPMRRNADGCGDCGACTFGCRRGAKRAGPRMHLAAATRSGARIVASAPVERVLVEDGRAVGVRASARRDDGRAVPVVVRARQVVVAAGALRTPVVLTRSGLDHPAIGAGLRLHPTVVLVARMPVPVEAWRGTLQGAHVMEFIRPGLPGADGVGPAHGPFLMEAAPAHPGLAALGLPWNGALAHRSLMEQSRYLAPLIGIVADRGSGRVRTTRAGRARIEYRMGREEAQTARRALVELARLARAGGAVEMIAAGTPGASYGGAGSGSNPADGETEWRAFLSRLAAFDFAPNRGLLFSAHQMGTARAGSDPRRYACDPWGRVRATRRGAPVQGLYVADTSLFPGSSAVNPMVTAMVLARRVTRAVLDDR